MNLLIISNLTFSKFNNIPTDVNVIKLQPGDISDQDITIKENCLFLNNVRINGFIFSLSPNTAFSNSFDPSDQGFCNTEIKSVILQILHTKEIFAINRFPASIWFNGLQWGCWRELFIKNDIKLTNLNFGWKQGLVPSEFWTNYTTYNFRRYSNHYPLKSLGFGQTNFELSNHVLFLYDNILYGNADKNINKAIKLLKSMDINFGRILTTSDGKIFSFDPCPEVYNEELRNTLNNIVYEKFKTYSFDRRHKRFVFALY